MTGGVMTMLAITMTTTTAKMTDETMKRSQLIEDERDGQQRDCSKPRFIAGPVKEAIKRASERVS